jgi:hypothetical protein
MALRIHITKPRDGYTTVDFDDSRGETRYRAKSGKIPVGDVGTFIAQEHAKFSKVKADIKAARKAKGVSP